MTDPVITDAPRRVIEAEIEHVMQHARNVLPRFPSPREWAALKDPAVDRLVGLLPSPSPSERREEIVRLARDIFLKHASGPRYYAPREIVTASEELADAILSLPAPAPTPSELVVGDRVRVHTGEEGTIDYFVPGRTKSVHVLIRPGFGGVYFPFECERLPAPAPAPVSSEGFVLVPVEPGTCELDDSGFLLAFVRELHSNAREAPVSWSDFSDEQRDRIKAAWRALIAAAPSPDQPSEESDETDA